jgi:iron complex outermembrane receptor protein
VEEQEKAKKVYKLDRVIVREHPLRDEALVVTPEVTVINVDEFEKAGPIETIRDLLSEAVGVDVLRTSVAPSPSESIYIRGLDQSRIQVFLDGRPMRLFGAYGYYKIDWTTMSLDNVETIEVIRGSHSLLYPFSMGGAINIITKKGIKTDKLKPEVSLKSEFGSFGMESYSAHMQGGLYSTLGYSFAAATRQGDGYLRNNYYDTGSFNGRISLYLPTDGTITFAYDYVDNETGYPVINDPGRDDFDPDDPVVLEGADWFTHGIEGRTYPGGDSFWRKRTNESGILLEQPAGPGEIRAQVYKHRSSRDRYGVNPDGTPKDAGIDSDEYTWGTALDLLSFELIGGHSFSLGGEYRNQGYPYNRDFYEIYSGYFQDVWSLLPSLTATYGFRYYRFESDAYRAGFPGWQAPEAELEQLLYRRVEKEYCPKFRLAYQMTPGLELHFAASKEMRLP